LRYVGGVTESAPPGAALTVNPSAFKVAVISERLTAAPRISSTRLGRT
jgi:hypothetical protein